MIAVTETVAENATQFPDFRLRRVTLVLVTSLFSRLNVELFR